MNEIHYVNSSRNITRLGWIQTSVAWLGNVKTSNAPRHFGIADYYEHLVCRMEYQGYFNILTIEDELFCLK